ncbi:hypothetical protein B0H16DRAFT_1633781 [Mycena metata]|uniref:Uncharacterized protein n=1 Tax=Mycena metata TaxID=1033252 RepID=A0AAD7M9Z3_9AGAR|nr:hypothetical protein B0H16DRAFT_1633781 [Mycena metata]
MSRAAITAMTMIAMPATPTRARRTCQSCGENSRRRFGHVDSRGGSGGVLMCFLVAGKQTPACLPSVTRAE